MLSLNMGCNLGRCLASCHCLPQLSLRSFATAEERALPPAVANKDSLEGGALKTRLQWHCDSPHHALHWAGGHCWRPFSGAPQAS